MSDFESKIQDYLNKLSDALSDQDKALLQDALFDAEQHFREALLDEAQPETAIDKILEDYGAPGEVAEQYRDMDSSVQFALFGHESTKEQMADQHTFFSVLKDASAYRALSFSFMALPLGILYFAWTMWAGVVTATASILVIGAPLFILYLVSMAHFSLFEGRLIEWLLGARMPRRPSYQAPSKALSLKHRIQQLLGNKQVWTSAGYLALKLPLGIAVFAIAVIPVLVAFTLMLSPIVDPLLHAYDPSFTIDMDWYWLPVAMPVGIVVLAAALHITKWLAKLQIKLARFMLIAT